MANREFVLLADTFKNHTVNGWFMSEKLDGQRAIWLPHTKGIDVSEIPFANRGKDNRLHVSTGLWSRYGKVIHAPKWWLDNFPEYPLDGELYVKRGAFQLVSSYVKKLPENRRDHEWKDVKYMAFDIPTLDEFYAAGLINNPNFKMNFAKIDRAGPPDLIFNGWDRVYQYLLQQFDNNWARANTPIIPHEQRQLPFNTSLALDEIEKFYNEIIEDGGEGLMFRKYTQMWTPLRVKTLLKMKPVNDEEGTIIGFTAGKNRLIGKLGALVIEWQGKQFKLAGLTDMERSLLSPFNQMTPGDYRLGHPDEQLNFSPFFKIGEKITFKYRELSDDGIPKDARYYRPANHID